MLRAWWMTEYDEQLLTECERISETAPIGAQIAPPAPASNRAERRKFERLRRKYDKWLKVSKPPKAARGEPAAPRPKPQPKPEPEVPVPAGSPDPIVVGKLVDSEEDVLFEFQEFYGEFNFRDSILDQLDKYFAYIARMKQGDPQAYDLYSKVGATLLPHAATGTTYRRIDRYKEVEDDEPHSETILPLWFLQQRPAFGCFSYGCDTPTEQYEKDRTAELESKHKRIYVPRFMYFQKFEHPAGTVQPVSGGDVYVMTVYWDYHDHKHKPAPQEFPMFVRNDGKVFALKKFEAVRVTLPRSKHVGIARKYYRDDRYFWHREWKYDNEAISWARQEKVTPEQLLIDIFVSSVRRWEFSSYSTCRVAVRKDGVTAQFGINPRRLSYFFQDREVTLTKNGVRQRVFHIVKPYIRSDGRAVPMHFRGERLFSWGPYEVEITVPGLDHHVPGEFDVGAAHDDMLAGEEGVTMGEIGQALSDLMHPGLRDEEHRIWTQAVDQMRERQR